MHEQKKAKLKAEGKAREMRAKAMNLWIIYFSNLHLNICKY